MGIYYLINPKYFHSCVLNNLTINVKRFETNAEILFLLSHHLITKIVSSKENQEKKNQKGTWLSYLAHEASVKRNEINEFK